MRSLVTGANGFVGRHLVAHLLDSGDEVVAIGRQGVSPFDTRVEYHSLDLLNAQQSNGISWQGIGTVYHLAGLAAVGPSFSNPDQYLNTNTEIQKNLFASCLQSGIRPRFIVVSTGGVYSPEAQLPVSEDSPTNPTSPYAKSKLLQEQLALGSGFEVIVARPFNHIGPGQAEGFLVADLTKQIVAGGPVLVGNLEAKRDYTDVRDIVRAYRLLATTEHPAKIYNVCSGRSLSGQAILDQLIALSGTKAEVKPDPSRLRPSDTPDIYGSYNRLHQDTGWQPKIDLETTLRDVLADWASRSRES